MATFDTPVLLSKICFSVCFVAGRQSFWSKVTVKNVEETTHGTVHCTLCMSSAIVTCEGHYTTAKTVLGTVTGQTRHPRYCDPPRTTIASPGQRYLLSCLTDSVLAERSGASTVNPTNNSPDWKPALRFNYSPHSCSSDANARG